MRVVPHGEIVARDAAKTNMIRGNALAVVVDDRRDDDGVARKRSDATRVLDAVLQDGDPRSRAAQPGEPGRGRRRLVRLRAEKHPIDGFRLCGIDKHRERDVDRPVGPLDHETPDRRPGASDDLVPVRIAQRTGDDAANAAETNDGSR